MGMYTEIFVNVDLKEGVPSEVLETVRRVCEKDFKWFSFRPEYPDRWGLLFNDGSCYTPLTSVGKLTYDPSCERWSLLGKGDIKNYGDEIEQFFRFIAPHVSCYDKGFMGYSRYEEAETPTLHYVADYIEVPE